MNRIGNASPSALPRSAAHLLAELLPGDRRSAEQHLGGLSARVSISREAALSASLSETFLKNAATYVEWSFVGHEARRPAVSSS